MCKPGKKLPYEERLAWAKQMMRGESDAQAAKESGCSIWTMRKWRRAYQKHGKEGLVSSMGRPKRGALSSYPAEIGAEIEGMRRAHPGWGPITLIEELTLRPAYNGVALPSRGRVAAFLKEKHLARPYERHADIPQPSREVSIQAHEEWELDAQGVQEVAGLGNVSVVNILDVVSRLKVVSYPLLVRKLGWLDYQILLRWAFVQHGLPERITLDHDSAFFDNTSHSPYPTHLHLWLVGLGVLVIFIAKRPPWEHAKIERTHQIMTAQAIQGQTWNSLNDLRQGLDQRRDFLNTIYPSRPLQFQAPLEAFPEAIHSQRPYRPEWEEELLDLNRIYSLLAQSTWFREPNSNGEFWLGMQRYNAGRSAAHQTQEISFDPLSLEFISKTLGSSLTHRFPAKGLSKTDLIGELAPFVNLPSYQLALPLTHQAWRQTQLAHLLGGTTL